MTESAPNADFRRKPQIFADSPLLLEIPAFAGRRKPQETADFRRKPQIFAENRRKPQIGLRHLRCVTFSSALDMRLFLISNMEKRIPHKSTRISWHELYVRDPELVRTKMLRAARLQNETSPEKLSLTLQSLLFWQKSEDPPKKARIFLSAEPLKSLEKRAKTHKKGKENRKTKKARKTKKKTRIPGSGFKSIRKTVWKTRKKIRTTIRNVFEKCLAPLRLLKNISPALFNRF